MIGRILNKVRRTLNGPEPWEGIPTMLHPNELRNLQQRAARVQGYGQVVDLGTWLGGSTSALASGLAKATKAVDAGVRVHAFDQFLVDEFSKRNKKIPQIQSLEIGDSFLPVFRQHLSKWSSLVEIHEGDAGSKKWTHGPIELMHIDVMKSWELAEHVHAEFFPALIPGKSVIIHQDYAHYWTAWIHPLMFRLRDHFEPLGLVEDSTSFMFRLKTAIPPELLRPRNGAAAFTRAEVDEAFEWSRNLISARSMHRSCVDAAWSMYYFHLGDTVRSLDIYQKAKVEEDQRLKEIPGTRRSELHQMERLLGLAG